MATYPANYTIGPGSKIERHVQKIDSIAEDGSIRSQLVSSAPLYELTIRHENLTETDTDTLFAFYLANLNNTSITWPDSITYTGTLADWVQSRNGNRWDVQMMLIGRT